MKDLAVLIVALMCIVGAGFWECSYLKETSRYLKTDLSYVDYYINLERYDDALDAVKTVKNTWNNMEETWSLFIHHDDIEFITVGIDELKSYINNSSKEDARATIAKLISNIDYTVECENVDIKNIF